MRHVTQYIRLAYVAIIFAMCSIHGCSAWLFVALMFVLFMLDEAYLYYARKKIREDLLTKIIVKRIDKIVREERKDVRKPRAGTNNPSRVSAGS
jgi:hypothetical protein